MRVNRRKFCGSAGSAAALSVLGPLSSAAGAADDEGRAYLTGLAQGVVNLAQMRDIAATKVWRGPWHWMLSGAEAERTLKANEAIYDELQLKIRRLIDVTRIDTAVRVFGQSYASPVGLSPIGFQKLFHPDHEVGTAAAMEGHGGLMIAGMLSSARYRDIAAKLTRKPWLQLYARWDRGLIKSVLDDVADAGCPAVALTVDTPVGGNRETADQYSTEMVFEGPMTAGNIPAGIDPLSPPDASTDWKFVEWLQANTRMKVLLKGVVTADDARIARKAGIDGLVVSNHGGRQEESNRSSLESLDEVVDAVGGSMPVLFDGGIRRGTDVFKALAVGADVACIGRPQIWGLGAFGEIGVARVLEILNTELKRTMAFVGSTSISQIGPEDLYPVARGPFEGHLPRARGTGIRLHDG